MGREWHCSRSLARREKESPGCMSGMLHYFDFHHLLFTASSRTVPPESPPEVHQSTSQLKGIEAPRNSLDLDTEKASSTLAIAEEYYDVPVGIQVVPKPAALTTRSKMVTLLEEERRSSLAETPRTPGVVARLMGLEVLADLQASSPATPCRRSPPSVKSQEQSRKIKNKKAFKGECRKESASLRQPLQNINCNVAGRYEVGSRSLPETPRVSSARSWNSDPRLSLQLNKENTNKAMQEFSYLCEVPGYHSLPPSPLPSMAKSSRRKNFGRQQDENKSPRGHYHGCEIVKQVKESMISTRRGGGSSSDEIDQVRSTRSPEPKISCNAAGTWSQNKSPPTKPPSEPSKSKPVKDHNIPKPHQLPNFPCPRAPPPSLPSTPNSFRARHNVEAKAVKIGPSKSCKKASYERFTERIKKQHPAASEKAARPGALLSPSQPASVLQKHLSEKKCRSPSFVTLKRKEASLPKASLPKARPVPEQVHHYCPSSSVQEQKVMIMGVEGALMPSKTQRCPQRLVPEEQDPEYGYVRSILELGGITGLAIPSFRWYSSSLPVDPIIFHQLELRFPFFPPEAEPQYYCKGELEEAILPSSLRHRWNRKLLFHLVEEILGDLLGWAYLTTCTHTNRPPVAKLHGIMSHRDQADGELLLKELWRQIQSFPSADCQVIGDIDALVAGDLPEAKIRRLLLHPLVVEEAEDVALEIEQEIFDGLLGETAASVALTSLYSQRNIAS